MNRMSDRAMARREMRDMARRDRAMRDYARGGRGRGRSRDYGYDMGYGRDMGDYARGGRDRGDYGYDMAGRRDYGYDMAEYDSGYGASDYRRGDRAGYGMDYERGGQSDMGKYPFELEGTVEMDMARRRRNSRGQFMRDRAGDGHYPMYPMMPYMDYGYGMDYGSGEKLSEEDLKEWYDELCQEIPEQYKHLYKKEHIEQVAKQMQIEFNKGFTLMEFVTTVAMLATDYSKSISPSDVQRYVSLAKEWLEDKDSNLKGGEKLSAYYDSVIKG